MLFVKSMMDRFRLEPRMEMITGAKWLVAYDLVKETYVKRQGSKKEYKRFRDSIQAFEKLEEMLKKGEW